MATAETARLIASLELKDNKFGPGIDRAIGKVGKLEGSLGRLGGNVQRGVQNAITNVTRLGIVGAAAVGGAIGIGVRSLADLARAEAQTAAVIESTGGKAGVSAGEVRKYAEELENLSTVDDKVIQDGENMLLTFTGISKEVFPQATKAALNMAVAMASGNVEQVDLKASAIQLGKALNDPVKGMTALRKVGVAFTKQQQDQIKALVAAGDTLGAQKVILRELELEFGKAGEAAGKGPEATWRRLQDVGEDLSQALARGVLPVLERFGTFLSTKLADPAVIATIDKLGQSLGEAGGKVLDFLETVDFASIGQGLELAAGAAGTLVGAFNSMPEWVKVAVVSGWGLNKLTGGALGGIIGQLGSGLIKGVLGMNAGVVNINAGVVNGGGVPGVAPTGGTGVVGKAASLLPAVAVASAITAAAVPIGEAFARALPPELKGPGGRGESEAQRRTREAREVIAANERQKAAIDAVKAQENRTTAAALLTAAAVQNLDRQKPPSVSVTTHVNVTAAQVNKSVVVQRRAGPSGGSRERSGPLEF